MVGMGRYTQLETELNNLSIDELNELYLSGDLDRAYDDFDRIGTISIRRAGNKGDKKKRNKRSRDKWDILEEQ